MARNFYEFNEELEKTNNPYRNTVQMTHGSYVSPYQQFKQQYPEFDAYGNKVLSGGYLKDNLRRFKQAGRNARLELQGKQPETEDNLLDYFGMGGMTAFKLSKNPIIVGVKKDGTKYIADGNHRYWAAMDNGDKSILGHFEPETNKRMTLKQTIEATRELKPIEFDINELEPLLSRELIK